MTHKMRPIRAASITVMVLALGACEAPSPELEASRQEGSQTWQNSFAADAPYISSCTGYGDHPTRYMSAYVGIYAVKSANAPSVEFAEKAATAAMSKLMEESDAGRPTSQACTSGRGYCVAHSTPMMEPDYYVFGDDQEDVMRRMRSEVDKRGISRAFFVSCVERDTKLWRELGIGSPNKSELHLTHSEDASVPGGIAVVRNAEKAF